MRADLLEQESRPMRDVRARSRRRDGGRAGRGREGTDSDKGARGRLDEVAQDRPGLRRRLRILRREIAGREVLSRMRDRVQREKEMRFVRARGRRDSEVLPGVRREVLETGFTRSTRRSGALFSASPYLRVNRLPFARETCCSRKSRNEIPASCNCCGTRELVVSPGSVFNSRKYTPSELAIRSLRE